MKYELDYPGQRNGNLPKLLKFADKPNIMVVACTYQIGTQTVYRFAAAEASPDSIILNYAMYYSVGLPNTIEDWCYQPDNFIEDPNTTYYTPTYYSAQYNVPPKTRNCTVPPAPTQGDFINPCGTLIASVYHVMGWYNVKDYYQYYPATPPAGKSEFVPQQMATFFYDAALSFSEVQVLADGIVPTYNIFGPTIYDRVFFNLQIGKSQLHPTASKWYQRLGWDHA